MENSEEPLIPAVDRLTMSLDEIICIERVLGENGEPGSTPSSTYTGVQMLPLPESMQKLTPILPSRSPPRVVWPKKPARRLILNRNKNRGFTYRATGNNYQAFNHNRMRLGSQFRHFGGIQRRGALTHQMARNKLRLLGQSLRYQNQNNNSQWRPMRFGHARGANKGHRLNRHHVALTARALRAFNNGEGRKLQRWGSSASVHSLASVRSTGSNRSIRSNTSIRSNRSIRSACTNRSYRSNGSARSFRSNRSNHSNRSNRCGKLGHPNRFQKRQLVLNRANQPNMLRQAHTAGRHGSFANRFRCRLNWGIQMDIARIQKDGPRKTSILLQPDPSTLQDMVPRPYRTMTRLSERFSSYSS